MVLAIVRSLPELKRGSEGSTGYYYYIYQKQVVRRCEIIIKIIPKNYRPKIGDIVNVRDASNKKIQLTIIQHDRPITSPVNWRLSYYSFGFPKEEWVQTVKQQNVIPLVYLEKERGILNFWTDCTIDTWTDVYHFIVLSLPMKLKFHFTESGEIVEKEVM